MFLWLPDPRECRGRSKCGKLKKERCRAQASSFLIPAEHGAPLSGQHSFSYQALNISVPWV